MPEMTVAVSCWTPLQSPSPSHLSFLTFLGIVRDYFRKQKQGSRQSWKEERRRLREISPLELFKYVGSFVCFRGEIQERVRAAEPQPYSTIILNFGWITILRLRMYRVLESIKG